MNKGTRNALLGFVAGVAAGAITGILLAPEKGSKTREKLSKKAKSVSKDLTDTLGEKIDKLKVQVNDIIHEMRGKSDGSEGKVKEKVNDKTKTNATEAKAKESKAK